MTLAKFINAKIAQYESIMQLLGHEAFTFLPCEFRGFVQQQLQFYQKMNTALHHTASIRNIAAITAQVHYKVMHEKKIMPDCEMLLRVYQPPTPRLTAYELSATVNDSMSSKKPEAFQLTITPITKNRKPR